MGIKDKKEIKDLLNLLDKIIEYNFNKNNIERYELTKEIKINIKKNKSLTKLSTQSYFISLLDIIFEYYTENRDSFSENLYNNLLSCIENSVSSNEI